MPYGNRLRRRFAPYGVRVADGHGNLSIGYKGYMGTRNGRGMDKEWTSTGLKTGHRILLLNDSRWIKSNVFMSLA
jgi:hypothetical protein